MRRSFENGNFPGGTSAAALYELERGRFRTVLSDAMWASYRRTTELERIARVGSGGLITG